MRKTLSLIALALLFAANAATAAGPARGSIKPPAAAETKPKSAAVSQQEKMRVCNQQASGKRGEERKTFMKACLSKKAP
jgi:hypothetical protein